MDMPEELLKPSLISQRFRGFLPVVVDVETGGFDAQSNALLEVIAVLLEMDSTGKLQIKDSYTKNIEPFEGAVVEQSALEFTGIDIYDTDRKAEEEAEALRDIFSGPYVERSPRLAAPRAVMVAHNAHFDLGFINAAVERNQIKRNPFHHSLALILQVLQDLPMDKLCLPRHVKRLKSSLITKMPTVRFTMPQKLRNYSVPSLTNGKRSVVGADLLTTTQRNSQKLKATLTLFAQPNNRHR